MKGWISCRIGKVVKVQQGLCINSKSNHLLESTGIPLLRITDLINNTEVQFINPQKVNKKFISKKTDLIFSRTGQVGLVFKNRVGVIHNNCFSIIPGELIDPLYMFYYLKQKAIYEYVNGVAGGAAQPDLGHASFKSTPFHYPLRSIQRKIASVLSAYDDLIENNNCRIAILEKMAEELYREWFVRLRFPGHEKTKITKGIPEGWEVVPAGKYFKLIKGRSYTSEEIEDYEATENHLLFITLKNFKRGGGFRDDAKKYYCGKYNDNQTVSGGALIIAVTDMTQDRAVIGEVARILKGSLSKGIISCDVVKIEPVNISNSFLYAILRFSSYSNTLKEFANGANVLHLKPELAAKQKVIIPPKDLRDQFDNVFVPLIESIDRLYSTLENLSTSRDRLLSRLMSGKIDVENMDIHFPASMNEEEVVNA